MKARTFDHRFDSGEDFSEALDLAHTRRPLLAPRRVAVELPAWMIDALDREARRLGVTRQSIIKVWLAEHLEQVAADRR